MSISGKKRPCMTKSEIKKNLKNHLTSSLKDSHNIKNQCGKEEKYHTYNGVSVMKERTKKDTGKGKASYNFKAIKAKKKEPREIVFSSRYTYAGNRASENINDLIRYLERKEKLEKKYSTGAVNFP